MVRLARNNLQKELLGDLQKSGRTEKLNEYVWKNREQKYRVGFAVKAARKLVKKLKERGYGAEYVEGKNGGKLTGYIQLI